MASGHVNRANRPNTWLHRPMLLREKSSCQLGAVHTWPLAGMEIPPPDVRFGPCVDGSEMARTFFTFAALVGAAMCSACLCGSHDRWP